MQDRIIVILATGEAAKARTGAMYALNALKHGWMEDVKLVLFGPAENLYLQDEDLQDLVRQFSALADQPLACRFLSDRDGISDQLGALGLNVRYVGAPISDAIRSGYVPMVW
ncbi:MAG TPA: hypothetical protein PLQ13_09440 [Candidatus Krumholzibacteria bacterium]|nr:hypothetical protein [Candidatus Krumholzibacteria bacterium]